MNKTSPFANRALRRFRTSLLGALSVALIVAFGAPRVAEAQAARSFEVRNVDTRVVETWIWDLCEENPKEECQVVGVSPGNPSQLTVRGSALIISKVARLLAERDSFVDPTQTFQILLVAATRGPDGMDTSMPKNAVEALEDVKQVLPFDSFRLLDTALLSTTRDGQTALSGPGDVRYDAQLRFRRVFSVDGPIVLIDTLRVQSEPIWRKPPGESGDGDAGWVHETVIDTSLSLQIDETAVVGTSKLDGGDEALILLITALPSS